MSEVIGGKNKAIKKPYTNCNPYISLHIKKVLNVTLFNTPGEVEPPPNSPHSELGSRTWKVRENSINLESSFPHEKKRNLVEDTSGESNELSKQL